VNKKQTEIIQKEFKDKLAEKSIDEFADAMESGELYQELSGQPVIAQGKQGIVINFQDYKKKVIDPFGDIG
jgi:hypothetical protein